MLFNRYFLLRALVCAVLFIHLLCKPFCHGLVIHRLGLPQALLWFLPLQTGERMLGTVTVGMCEPIATSCRESSRYE